MKAKFLDCPPFLHALYQGELAAIVPDLEINVGSPSRDEAIAFLADAAFAMNDHSMMDEAFLRACPGLRAIVFLGTGAASFIDLAAAERLGIRVRAYGGYGDRSVAEHAVALMFAAARQIAAMDRAIRRGRWETLNGIELAGKVLGVVGSGGIGREMVRLGAALGMRVIAWNRSGVPQDLPCRAVELDALLAEADVVSLHVALNEGSRGLIDRRRIGLLRPGAILINTARGAILDEAALVDALRDGRIGHAGLDVFADEPLPADHPLTRLDNVTLTAHAAFMTEEASARLLRMALELLAEERAA
ncbi:MAG TPA: NAD(P)-dependent oxidoreductase [Geminicoccaceae bacterium]|nr:NAD(P)-dependent oxidoreductase [Geminicoccaceae bacterium]